ncbi:DUF378 domain-containing protein [Clostridium chromiireducens]|uniref:DUF378 domain-containing protein n=1 Tax=Clostridium chromiireducens TaxID=225345 RepID=A0A399IS92_9CLOT|nr:DUF378 domain-containing protein [Clostridium chromiireducens]MVX66907.1 DUF378 domain-containing protein [Clostridium chromiireducens]RII35179.1 DUF378 domain-containing protein [Clostridium chromiireducens]
MCKLNLFDKLSFLLVFLGSLNWGTIGLFNLNFVNMIFLHNSIIVRISYIIIFLAALNIVTLFFRCNLLTDDN